MAEMTLERAKKILADTEGKYSVEAREKAQKVLEGKEVKSSMTDERADKILNAPDGKYREDVVQAAREHKNARAAGFRAPKSDWVKVYTPIDQEEGFKFNWREAYDKKVDPEDLKSLQSLDDFRKGKMWNVDDDVNLKNQAVELRFMHPEESWTDFLNSDRFLEFQKYLEDVRKHQTENAVEKIWSGEEPSESYYPGLGTANVPLSKAAVDFMLPVSKQYAMKNYENMETKDLAPSLIADGLANVVMTGAGKGAVAAKPLLSHLYANLAAPAITEGANVLINDKDLKKAGINTLEGYLVNRQTGKILDRYLPKAENVLRGKLAQRQKVIDDAVNAAVETENKMKGGATMMNTNIDGTHTYLKFNKGKPVQISEEEFLHNKGGHITDQEFLDWAASEPSIRRLPNLKKIYESAYSALKTPRSQKIEAAELKKRVEEVKEAVFRKGRDEAKNKIAEKINNGEQVSIEELRKAGLNTKESISNFLRRLTNNSVGDYLTNMAGRPEFGRKGLGSFLSTMIPGVDLFKDETESEKKSKLKQAYGL